MPSATSTLETSRVHRETSEQAFPVQLEQALRRIARTEQLHVAVNIAPIMPTADNQVLGVKTRALSAEGAAEIFKLKRDHVKRDTMSTKVRVR